VLGGGARDEQNFPRWGKLLCLLEKISRAQLF